MSMNPNRPGAQRKFPFPIWVLIAALVVLAIAIWGAYSMRGGGGGPMFGSAPAQTSQAAAPATSDQPTGQLVRVVVKVDQIDSPTALHGHVATQNSQGAYAATDQQIEVDHPADAQVAMGSASDLKAGALLQISGTSTTDSQGKRTIHASEIVNLTGFVSGG
ncbi:MAG TPA: hypothetical protein VJ914_28770 [Pseudonocardiaceae bacterium]|nr:hypothetical protein [Pseudonocardiaceae bacterium]